MNSKLLRTRKSDNRSPNDRENKVATQNALITVCVGAGFGRVRTGFAPLLLLRTVARENKLTSKTLLVLCVCARAG